MSDTSKYKSIALSVDTYKKLQFICQKEHRHLNQQMSKFVDDYYNANYADEKKVLANRGVGSIAH